MERQTCERVGVSDSNHPPVLVVAGEGYLGHTTVETLEEAVAIPEKALKALKSADAILFGRDTCVWTQRQKAILGDDYQQFVTLVDCEKTPGKCGGIQGVPTWQFGTGAESVRLPGFRFLGDLLRLSIEHGSKGKNGDAGSRDGERG